MTSGRLGISVFFIVLALVLAALAFATDHWQVWIVDRESLKNDASQASAEEQQKVQEHADYFTRYHGLLRTCYPGNDTTDMLRTKEVVDQHCVYIDYQLAEAAQYLSTKSNNFWMAMHIRRLLFGLTVMGMVLLLLSLVLGTYGCWTVKPTGTSASAIMLFLALLMQTGVIGTLFGLNFLETNRVPEFKQSVLLAKHSVRMFSWSFYIHCCSAGLTLLAFTIVSIVAFRLHREQTLARRAAAKMRNYYDELQKKNSEPNLQTESRAPSPLQKAVTEANGEKMVPILMFDNAGFDHDKNVLY